jgi:phosphoglycerate kinase
MVEEDLVDTAAGILRKAREKGVTVLLPTDLVVAETLSPEAKSAVVAAEDIPGTWLALDIGPQTAKRFSAVVREAATVVWNGPMGVFEMDAFSAGTRAVAEAIAGSDAYSVVGGGDTGLAVKRFHVADRMGYISTGGGAFLHLMEGKALPGAVALEQE